MIGRNYLGEEYGPEGGSRFELLDSKLRVGDVLFFFGSRRCFWGLNNVAVPRSSHRERGGACFVMFPCSLLALLWY